MAWRRVLFWALYNPQVEYITSDELAGFPLLFPCRQSWSSVSIVHASPAKGDSMVAPFFGKLLHNVQIRRAATCLVG